MRGYTQLTQRRQYQIGLDPTEFQPSQAETVRAWA